MKRIILVSVVSALALAASALPALATNFGKEGAGPPLFSGYLGKTLVFHCQAQGGKGGAVFFAKGEVVRGNCR